MDLMIEELNKIQDDVEGVEHYKSIKQELESRLTK